ncbi:hypothetical protein PAAG_06424 [Paracoccidioides lutzii Pb01]|uniref:Cell division control protein 73 C-terminal domain-containing protein n=1 Tax=Paracoccidioides lutzii (strain ATCC MYA-826 / Pb01) TaxID=502779 RepID=C1H6N3_PARBA|nr:hypothetical protein PAAG_06424 [Paracoccidioides lutzii Pb01]EEH35377.1 hypothetical protein PAAG_06424 [Paracoccidioides lutzii Pb01]
MATTAADSQTSTDPLLTDPLLCLRRALSSASTSPVLLTTSLPPSTSTSNSNPQAEITTTDLALATQLYLPSTPPYNVPQCIPLSTPTRFISSASGNIPIDLRSIYFAWLKRDVAIPEYIASAQSVNEEVEKNVKDGKAEGEGGIDKVLNLVFVERLDLITWLEGASEDSEYIKPLAGEGGSISIEGVGAGAGAGAAARSAQEAARVATGAAGGTSTVSGAGVDGQVAPGSQAAGVGVGGRPVRTIDPRLQEIYNGERKMGDRNSVLRGIRPTEFSHVRKTAEMFLGRNRSRPSQHTQSTMSKSGVKPQTSTSGSSLIKQATPPSSANPSSRRPNPIILLSPSASSLLRMSNIKSFLSDGVYVPPDHPTLATSTAPNLLYISRALQTISDPTSSHSANKPSSSQSSAAAGSQARRSTRFILVDSTADFKPDYWNRVVAVFTTGQTWQFKSYKWSSPPELFKHATGIYVGWRGEDVPREVKGWGRGVRSFAIDRWDEKSAGLNGAGAAGLGAAGGIGGSGRWRDRGVVEGIWMAIEEGMRGRGWGGGKGN